ENQDIPARNQQRAPKVLLEARAEHKSKQYRRRVEIEQEQEIADEPDDNGLANLKHVVVGRVDADGDEEQRAWIRVLVGDHQNFTHKPIMGTLSTTRMMLPIQKLATSPQKMSGCSLISRGPGTIPWIINAPRMSAITASPGMPRLMVGMKSPCTEECVAASGQATPSIMPVPNFSGVFETFFSVA